MSGINVSVLLCTNDRQVCARTIQKYYHRSRIPVYVLDSSRVPDPILKRSSTFYVHCPGANFFEKLELFDFSSITTEFCSICSDDEFKIIPTQVSSCVFPETYSLHAEFFMTMSQIYEGQWNGRIDASYNPSLIYGVHRTDVIRESVDGLAKVPSDFFGLKEVCLAASLFRLSREGVDQGSRLLWFRNNCVRSQAHSWVSRQVFTHEHRDLLSPFCSLYEEGYLGSAKFVDDVIEFFEVHCDVSVVEQKYTSVLSCFHIIQNAVGIFVRTIVRALFPQVKIQRVHWLFGFLKVRSFLSLSEFTGILAHYKDWGSHDRFS